MNNNLLSLNQHLFEAYHHLQSGNIEKSLQQYHKSLKYTYNPQLKDNIKCTIAILNHHTAQNNDQSYQYLHSIINNCHQESHIVIIRALVNLILINVIDGKLSSALDGFQKLMEIIQREEKVYQKKQFLQFATFLFFRVKNFQDIEEFIQNLDLTGMKIQEINCMSLMAFNSEICKFQSQQKIQKQCYQQFLKHQRYDLAIFSLRSLIKYTKNSINKKIYEKELGELIMLGFFSQDVNFNNYEMYDVIQAIAEQFIKFRNKINQEIRVKEMNNFISEKNSLKSHDISDQQLSIQWKFTLMLIHKEVIKGKDMDVDKKSFILNILANMQNENNMLVIRETIKNLYFCKYHQKVRHIFRGLSNVLKMTSKKLIQETFYLIKKTERMPFSETTINRDNTSRSKLNLKSEKNAKTDKNCHSHSKRKQQSFIDKQNNHHLGISIVSITSSKISSRQTRRKIFQDQGIIYTAKKIQKMIKAIQYGCFLNKRNYNSQGGQYKFVKINNTYIKWAKDPQKIQSNCQKYPLKDIKSITYGRVSQNLNQSANKILSYSKCFTLLFQKRTLDFYCKNYEELEAWVCGLTSILKKQKCKIVGYTPGKLRWKKMFAILKEHFIEPLRTNQRKYRCENSYAVILFAKNGYKLPRTIQK